MIVAARTSNALPQKRFRYVLREIDRVFMQYEVVQLAIATGVTRTGEDFTSKLVPRLVGFHAVANPVVKGPHRVGAQLTAGDKQKVGPFVSPVIDKFIAPNQAIDKLLALVG